MKKKFLLIGLLLFGFYIAQSQELISNSGDTFSNSSYEISWSLGEVCIDTYSNGDFILGEGFHNANIEISRIDENIKLNVSIYPNPTSDFITISSTDVMSEIHLNITDMNGKVLNEAILTNREFQIDLSQFTNGVYLLNLIDKNFSNTFKIIKN